MTTRDDELGIDPALIEDTTGAGWSLDFVRRAREAGMPAHSLHRYASWGLPEPIMEKRLGWHVKLTHGLRGRLATLDDNAAFCELWAEAPESIGEFDVVTERGPNAFAQYRLQRDVHLLVIADGQRLAASCGFAIRNVLVGGERISVHYGQGLRVHRDYRRQGFGDQVRSLGWGINFRPTVCQYDIMRTQNFAVVGWWEKYMPDFWKDVPKQEGEVPGIPVIVYQLPAREGIGEDPAIRPVRAEDLERCAELINRTHDGADLFHPYTAERLEDRLDQGLWGERPPWWQHVYGWEDAFVLEEQGRVVACGGLWNRGRDLRERWRHRESGKEHTLSDTCLLDFGYEAGAEAALMRLLATFSTQTAELGRDHLLVPAQHLPELAVALEAEGAVADRRALRWGHPSLQVVRPYTDLAYW